MGQFITIRDKRTQEEVNIALQEYAVGLYVIESNNPARQYGFNGSAKEFIDLLKKNKEIEVIE